ncbi:hypothetical protein BJAS_P3485 [Bathymodiolus japonicus methanotrophic gill symbiont]|uniref:hypothetical protein n=1 Tax=Bathymodiolus japonicus methanotrophic gill symbiont TaxID=113269 RepID=UPI001B529750|nr:hypothetical protein [Bathymodiolus japonicus methanotrophic gill symbiont]GFO72948.1 hypothetical protein BJAS_P3485 [Bathymodiolus japonicus methanotrophic gill symbiont]
MNKLLKVVAIGLMLSSFNAHSANGGSIRIVNDTDKFINVTWSAWGCFGVYAGLTLICESQQLRPGGTQYRYTYAWGITGTWVNVGIKEHQSFDNTVKWHPCSTEGNEDNCVADHYVVDTDSHETDQCIVKEHKVYPPYPPEALKKEEPVITYTFDCHRE